MPRIKTDIADKYFSQWIRSRDDWTCQRCYKRYEPPTAALHASHFMGRGKEPTRFEPTNVDALCYGCHSYFTAQPVEHYAWQVKRKGQVVVDKLRLASNTYCKKNRELEAIYWKAKLKKDFNI